MTRAKRRPRATRRSSWTGYSRANRRRGRVTPRVGRREGRRLGLLRERRRAAAHRRRKAR